MAAFHEPVIAGFENVTSAIWKRIGFNKKEENLVLKVLNRAKSALSKTMGEEGIIFRRRHDDAILKIQTLHITTCLSRVPGAGREQEKFFEAFKKNFKVSMMKVNEPFVHRSMEGISIQLRLTHPPSTTLSFDLTADAGDRHRPQDDLIRFSSEGLQSLACFKDVISRNLTWRDNITAEMAKAIVVAHVGVGQSKGAIVHQIMLALSQAVAVPGVLAALDEDIREAIAEIAQVYLNDPRLLNAN